MKSSTSSTNLQNVGDFQYNFQNIPEPSEPSPFLNVSSETNKRCTFVEFGKHFESFLARSDVFKTTQILTQQQQYPLQQQLQLQQQKPINEIQQRNQQNFYSNTNL